MDYTLEEIKKHKNKIYELSSQLINTFDINDEISINDHLKHETEFLLSLLNIKKNEINRNNKNINNFSNFMMNNQFLLQMNPPMIQPQNIEQQMRQQLMEQQMAQQTDNRIYKNNIKIEEITVKYIKNGKINAKIKVSNDLMVAELIN